MNLFIHAGFAQFNHNFLTVFFALFNYIKILHCEILWINQAVTNSVLQKLKRKFLIINSGIRVLENSNECPNLVPIHKYQTFYTNLKKYTTFFYLEYMQYIFRKNRFFFLFLSIALLWFYCTKNVFKISIISMWYI